MTNASQIAYGDCDSVQYSGSLCSKLSSL